MGLLILLIKQGLSTNLNQDCLLVSINICVICIEAVGFLKLRSLDLNYSILISEGL